MVQATWGVKPTRAYPCSDDVYKDDVFINKIHFCSDLINNVNRSGPFFRSLFIAINNYQ